MSKDKCPHCSTYISFTDKFNLMDFRECQYCEVCNNAIRLPIWHTMLYILELLSIPILAMQDDLSGGFVVLMLCSMFLFIAFVQLPLTPIVGD